MRKFARRHKALVGGVVATLVVAVVGALVATGFAIDATNRAAELERALYIQGLATAEAAIDEHRYAQAATTLAGLPEAHRSWEYDHLLSRLQPHAMHFEAPGAKLPRHSRWPGLKATYSCVAPNSTTS